MSNKTKITVQDCIQGAWQALLKGDLEGRDRLCAMAERAFEGQDEVAADKDVLKTITGKRIN